MLYVTFLNPPFCLVRQTSKKEEKRLHPLKSDDSDEYQTPSEGNEGDDELYVKKSEITFMSPPFTPPSALFGRQARREEWLIL